MNLILKPQRLPTCIQQFNKSRFNLPIYYILDTLLKRKKEARAFMCHEAKGKYRWRTNHYKSNKLHSVEHTACMHRRLPLCFTKSKGILCHKHKGLRGNLLRQRNSNVHLYLGNILDIFIIIFNDWLSLASFGQYIFLYGTKSLGFQSYWIRKLPQFLGWCDWKVL